MSTEELDFEEITNAAKMLGVTVRRAPINYVDPNKPQPKTKEVPLDTKAIQKMERAKKKAAKAAQYREFLRAQFSKNQSKPNK